MRRSVSISRKKISEQRKKSGEVFCDRALEIIEERYHDPELSVVTVSGEIGVSPNYLSALIKKTTDSTFVRVVDEETNRESEGITSLHL